MFQALSSYHQNFRDVPRLFQKSLDHGGLSYPRFPGDEDSLTFTGENPIQPASHFGQFRLSAKDWDGGGRGARSIDIRRRLRSRATSRRTRFFSHCWLSKLPNETIAAAMGCLNVAGGDGVVAQCF